MNVKPIGTLLVQASSESMLPKEKLEQLVGEPDSGIEKVKQVIHVAIHPRYCSNVGLGVMNSLNKLINNWHPQLNGILAGYGKLQLKKPTGTILNEDAYFHIDVQSEFWLFRPLTGRQLKGIVTKKSDKHVSVLVHGIFNIPCLRPNNLKKDWWGMKAKLKCPAHLTVVSTDMSQKVPQIMGDLQNIGLDGTAAQKINFDETVPSPEVEEYSDDDWNDVVKKTSKKVQKSPTKVKQIPTSSPSSGASSDSEESEPARNQVNHLTPPSTELLQSSEEDSKDSNNQKKSDSSDDEEDEETTKIRDLKASPTKNSNENPAAVTSTSKAPAVAASKRKPVAKFTDEQKSSIVKEVVESLISPADLSKKYGASADTIRTWVKKAGFDLPKAKDYKKSTTATAPSKKSESKKSSFLNNVNSLSEKKKQPDAPAPAPDVRDILAKLMPDINNIQLPTAPIPGLPSPKKSPKKSPVKKPKLEKITPSKISIPPKENHTALSTSEDDNTEKNEKIDALLNAVTLKSKNKKKKKSSKKEKNDFTETLESPSKKSKLEVSFSSQDPELDAQREEAVTNCLENSDLLNDDDNLKKKKKKSKKEKYHEKTREIEEKLNNDDEPMDNNVDNIVEGDYSSSTKKNKKKKRDKYETFHHENIISTPTKRKPEVEPEVPSTAPPSKKSKKSRLSFDTSTPINVANQFSFDRLPGKIDHAKMNDSGLEHSLDESSSKPKKKKKEKKEKKDK